MPAEQTLMAADMAEQPAVLRGLIARRSEIAKQIGTLIETPPRGIALVGRGSSDNAAQFGRIVLENATAIPTMQLPPSMVRLYDTRTDLSGFLVIGLSQSGYTPEIEETLQRAKANGAKTLGITADGASPLAVVSDLWLDLGTGTERAIPATKTFTAELAMLALIAESIGVLPLTCDAWETTADVVEYSLADVGPIVVSASRLNSARHVFTLAAGAVACLAHEAALKIMEASGVAASGFSPEAFRHGPIAIAGPQNPVIVIAPAGPARDDVERVYATLSGIRAVIIGPQADVPTPRDLPEVLGAIPAAVRVQQLALEMARRRGVNPDHPRRTEKVLAL